MAISVTVAVGDAADELVEKIRLKALNVTVGPGLEPTSEMGPLVTPEARDRVKTTSAAAKATWSWTGVSSRSRATASSSARR